MLFLVRHTVSKININYLCTSKTYNVPDMQRYCYSILDKYSGPVRAWLGPMLLVIIRSAEDMQTLATNAGCLDKVEIFAKTNPFSALATSPGMKEYEGLEIL